MVPGCGTSGTFGTSGTQRTGGTSGTSGALVMCGTFGTIGTVEMDEALKLQTSLVSNCLKLEFPRCRAIVSRGHGQNYKYLSFDSFRINLNHFMN